MGNETSILVINHGPAHMHRLAKQVHLLHVGTQSAIHVASFFPSRILGLLKRLNVSRCHIKTIHSLLIILICPVSNVKRRAKFPLVKVKVKVRYVTWYSAAPLWTHAQERFTISEVAADCWHELMIPQRIMRPSIARASEKLDPRRSMQTYHRPNQLH